ncbi:MAG: DUF1631 family protein [Burkholderiales bacterium]
MSGHSRKRFELLEGCRELVLQRMGQVVADALDKMSDELMAEALRSFRSDQQQALLDAAMLVRENRSEIETRFRRSFGDIFERRLYALDRPSAADGATATAATDVDAPLQLVSDDVIRDQMSVDRLIGRTKSRLDPDEVLGIRARLGALLDRDWFEEGKHPVSPEAVFEALKNALAELTPRTDVKVALLDAFEPHVSQNLNGLYAAVNERLRSNHVLPKIRPQVQTFPSTRRPGESAAHGPDAAGAGPQQGARHAGRNQGGSPQHGGGTYGTPTRGGAFRAGTSPGPGGAQWEEDGAAAAAVDGDGYGVILDPMEALQAAMVDATAGRPTGRMQVARMLSNPAMFGVADIPVAPVQRPLVASLTAIQRDPERIDVAGMPPAIVEQVREQGSPLDQITVEIVSMVFDYIYSDRRLPDSIKQQLLRLQVVAVKAALLDRSFFARRQHPMRRLIDRISDVGADPDADLGRGSPMTEGLARVVDRIVAEFDADLSMFERCLEEIEALARDESERRAASLAAVAREAAMRETLAIAQDEARTELGRRLDKDTPPFVREFLYRWWTQVLARQRADHEGESAVQAWEAAMHVADCLVWSVAPKQSDEIVRLATVLPNLIRGMKDGLARVEIPDAERTAFLDELLRAHALEIAAAKKRWQSASAPAPAAASASGTPVSVRMQPDGTVRFEPRTEEAEGVPTVSASDQVLSAMRRGQRIEIEDEAGARVFKLAWISPARKLFILTRQPEESLTLQSAEFAFMLQRGQARIVPDDSTFDRAIGSVTGGEPAASGTGGGHRAAPLADTQPELERPPLSLA